LVLEEGKDKGKKYLVEKLKRPEITHPFLESTVFHLEAQRLSDKIQSLENIRKKHLCRF